MTQKFASGATLFWIPGGATEGCGGECTGYEVEGPGSLVKRVRVNLPTDSDKFVLMVFPTDAGFRGGIDKAVDGWQEVWTNTPNPLRLDTADEAESLRNQYACHAAYARQESDGSWNTGNSWDLESDRPNVSWTYATDALFWRSTSATGLDHGLFGGHVFGRGRDVGECGNCPRVRSRREGH
ncbi:DUF2599 domain-containing protein [Streptomyces sp. CSDS2]|uniref:DUF2599 domain-containing protein n=1 Tax=Streptomyces sp. CSDS2 TaxID=3055051 RepID=UPI0025AF9832|nr:DUF2599 domain-containing protein [Streptomyces sp. CSDS2]MDN3263254.1 DUF2599 domain-containing protein [Streptomyces sp. CSDS2]